MLFGVFHVLIKASDHYYTTGFVLWEPNVHFKLLHHFRDGLTTSSNEAAVDAMVDNDFISDLLLLKSCVSVCVCMCGGDDRGRGVEGRGRK